MQQRACYLRRQRVSAVRFAACRLNSREPLFVPTHPLDNMPDYGPVRLFTTNAFGSALHFTACAHGTLGCAWPDGYAGSTVDSDSPRYRLPFWFTPAAVDD